ncbi:FliH/SctL family protein [Malaciobacter marinus]|uniref:Flagellar assembly protein FliH n=1 Tax=Malaciobacter marinus TaxID=505249 RepID=A0A347TMZ6_9BACT|nr:MULTISPECIES: FliH/SctL family protein [Malaciobacter]AXX87974.1 flagellar export apparatus, cytoplasmic ATPase complex, FliH component [Malaciobacter marinus]PHO13271.1 flagellar assembly protein FliH [Malaciobacter marinus]PHO16024.1 flagellar assembly protein FliH [Malaciobacter marinus]RYA24796.1 flagellar assembly protein FliH [Malaciobacter halophilus]
MANNNVYSTAKVISSEDNVQDYKLGTFLHNNTLDNSAQKEQMQNIATLSEREIPLSVDPLVEEIKNISAQIANLNLKVDTIEQGGVSSRDVDRQVVEAIKDLKHYATFFEQATFQMESKLLKTSVALAQKIISIEVGENSTKIAKETISHLLSKIKTASRVKIHLNPRDYEILRHELKLESFIELTDDINVAPGGVVIASDLGNFDGNIEAKVASMLETLDTVI